MDQPAHRTRRSAATAGERWVRVAILDAESELDGAISVPPPTPNRLLIMSARRTARHIVSESATHGAEYRYRHAVQCMLSDARPRRIPQVRHSQSSG